MFKSTFILISLLVQLCFANTNGGGVLSMVGYGEPVSINNGTGTIKSTWLKYKGMDRSDFVFEYGQQNHTGDLFTQTIKLRAEEFGPEQDNVSKAIKASQEKQDWIQVSPAL